MFKSDPTTGPAHDFAFWFYGYSIGEQRATFLNAIADEIEARAERSRGSAARKPTPPKPGWRATVAAPPASFTSLPPTSLKGVYLDRRHNQALPTASCCRTPI